ncbi:hypothetical protein RFI_03567 [Reticulomyxa filosa]|uniref:Uncharacterized protein n=1 Tax=Reticulomyxa filosa TaxID=46433 RepID=X6P7C3_RETFI|nr:hypothetical protein RFI_03567 [Reticulomyxa filosa]|eukprot:ETO33537.1 hypothetical protein RFI_03567 [Reticulomyxa filosa]
MTLLTKWYACSGPCFFLFILFFLHAKKKKKKKEKGAIDNKKKKKSMDDVTEVMNAHGGSTYCRYMECSAFTGENVEAVFKAAVIIYREWREHGGNEAKSNEASDAKAKEASGGNVSNDVQKSDRAYSALEEEPMPAQPIELELQHASSGKNLLYHRQSVSSMQEQVRTSCMSWLISHTFCCPTFSQYLSMDGSFFFFFYKKTKQKTKRSI